MGIFDDVGKKLDELADRVAPIEDVRRNVQNEQYARQQSKRAKSDPINDPILAPMRYGNEVVNKNVYGYAEGGEVQGFWDNFANSLAQAGSDAKQALTPENNPLIQGMDSIKNAVSNVGPGNFNIAPAAPSVAQIAPAMLENIAPPQQVSEQLQQSAVPIRSPQPIVDAVNQQIRGVQQQANVEGQMGREQAMEGRMQQERLQGIHQRFNDFNNDLEIERKAIADDLKNNHIDSRRYFKNLDTSSQVATAIGLILGGMGSGVTGGENPALKVLQQNIENDIKAQMTDRDTKANLLTHLERQFGNQKDAIMMYRILATDAYAAKIQAIADQSKSPLAKARAEQRKGELKATVAPLQSEMAFRQAIIQGVKAQEIPTAAAITVFVPENQQKDAFEELKEHEIKQQTLKDLDLTYKELEKLQSTASRAGDPIQSKSQIDALNLRLAALARPMFGKVSDAEIKLLEESARIGYLDNAETIAKKRQNLENILMRESAHPVLDAHLKHYGLGPKPLKGAANFKPIKNAPYGKR